MFQQSSHGENMMLEIIANGNSKEQVSSQLLTKQNQKTSKQKNRHKNPHNKTKKKIGNLGKENSFRDK